MIRILEVFREPIANGGQESFLMNMYRNIDREKVQMDFMTPFTCDNNKMKKEIIDMGGRVYSYNYPFGKNNNQVFKKCMTDFMKKHKYNTVHIHSGSTYALMEGSKIARLSGVKNIIVHSHCGGFANIKYYIIKTLSIQKLLKYPTHYCACSKLAAEWKFPKKIIKNNSYEIIKNAIDLERFSFDRKIRSVYRERYNFQEKFVVGHIGRFAIQKNHEFLIDIFEQICKLKENAELVLIGDGELKDKIIEKVKKKNLQERVHFWGIRSDTAELLNMMDIFVLPSFFEGLPVVGVEAQATGLPVICSDKIAKELPISSLSYFIPLEKSPKEWAKKIVEIYDHYDRNETKEEMAAAGYDIKLAAKQLECFYLEINS